MKFCRKYDLFYTDYIHRKNGIAEASKNLVRNQSENNFV